jgi:predicted XRE-type DNA-binding protein
MLSRNEDFHIFDGKARLSQRKVAELLGISQKSVSLKLNSHTLFTVEEAEIITQYGFDGDTLTRMTI